MHSLCKLNKLNPISPAFLQILSDLKQARARVLQLLPDPHHSTEQLETAIKLYLSLTRGFLEAKTSDEDKMQASKLRHAIRCVQGSYVCVESGSI